MARAPEPCPCGRPSTYARCCGVFHRGEAEAPDAESLMRSRYSAFARGEVEYLWRTLHESHADRAMPEAAVLRGLRESARTQRFMGLSVLDAAPPDTDGVARVLFHAKIFVKGRDHSFAECSDFLHDGRGWRYVRGEMRAVRDGSALRDTTIEMFLRETDGA